MRTWVSWSSGKDSAWSLHVLRGMPGVEVTGLFTTLNAAFDRVAMHAVRRTLLEMQADGGPAAARHRHSASMHQCRLRASYECLHHKSPRAQP